MRSLILLFLLSMIMFSCSGGDEDFLSREERAWLESREGEISVLFGPDNPPENFTNEMGVYTGMLVDYSRELEDILGYRFVRKIFSSWAGLMDFAEKEKHFIIVGAGRTARREGFLLFGSKLVDVDYVLVTKKGVRVESPGDMVGKTYCAVDGYSIFDVNERILPGVKLVPVRNTMEGLKMVVEGKLEGMVDVSLYTDYSINSQNLKDLEVHDVIDFSVDYHIGVSRSDEELVGIMEKALHQISTDRHRELSAIWRNLEMKRVDPRLWRILFSSLGALILVIGIALIWVHSLRCEVARKTEIILKDEQKRMEADRSDSLRVLAGGISHDLNNLLTGLYGYMEIAKVASEKGEDTEIYLDQVLKSLDDSRNLSRQLLSFSKGEIAQGARTTFAPASYIREMADFSLHGKHLEVELDIPDDLWTVKADRGRIGQVISNLIINAVQAMGDKGTLWIKAQNLMEKGDCFVELSIRDDGPGVSAAIQNRIFDPYFTTKEEGSGLGLASCRAIAADHGGSLTLNSRAGEGAEFILRLPALKVE